MRITGFCGLKTATLPPTELAAASTRMAEACHGNQSVRDLSLATLGLSILGAPCASHQDEHGAILVFGEPYWEDGEAVTSRGLAERWRTNGNALPTALRGTFALVGYRTGSGELMLATDRMARCTLYWRALDDGIAFAPSAAALLDIPGQPKPGISHQGVYHYIYFHMVPGPDSIYTGIGKLPPGSRLLHDARGTRVENYWQPRFANTSTGDPAEARQQCLRVLRDAVQRQDQGTVSGCFLSGGLDSSTISGLTGANRDSPADTYSIGFDAEGYDEIAYARIANQHFGNRGHEYYVTPSDVLDQLPRIAAAYDEPFGNSSALAVYFCAKFAREDGREHLLAGDGGDELFAGNERYAKQKLFEAYAKVPGALRALLEQALRSPLGTLPLARKGRSYVEQAGTPLPDRLQSYNFLHRMPATAVFNPDFMADVDKAQPLRELRDVYQSASADSYVDRMLHLDWHYTLAYNDLRKVNRMCELADIGVSYPFLDDEVVDFSMSLPGPVKLPGQRLRGFYRDAVRNFLPREILEKSKHGFGLPFGVWMRENKALRDLAADSLASLADTHYFRAGLADEVLTMHRDGHASYYGELVWILVSLGLWLDAHEH